MPTYEEITAALQAEIARLPRNLAYKPSVATAADAADLMALATAFTAGVTSCGWEPLIAKGEAEFAELLARRNCVITRDKRGVLCSFTAFDRREWPVALFNAVTVNPALSNSEKLKAVAVLVVVFYRAVIALGYTSARTTPVPPGMRLGFLELLRANDQGMAFRAINSVISITGEVEGYSLVLDLTTGLANMETALGL